MTGHREPRTTDQAQAMLERYAELQGQIDLINAARDEEIVHANARADTASSVLIAERDLIGQKLEPWWKKAAPSLTLGKRKSIELGGCMIGTRQGKDSLGTADDLEPVIAWLQKRDWAGPLLRVVTSIDKAAVLKSIDGVYKKQLANLGFRRVDGGETFFVKPTDQGGTRS